MKLPPLIRNQITKFLTTQFRYLLMAVAFVIILVGYLLLLQPQIQNVQQQGVGELRQVEQRLEQRRQYLTRLQDMVEKYRDVVGQQTIPITDILPATPEIGKVFLTFEQLLKDVGLTLESVAVSKGQSLGSAATSATRTAGSTATIQVLDVNLGISGTIDYPVFKRLLTNFERSIRIFDIPAITFAPIDETQLTAGETATSQLTLEVKTYYLQQQEPK